MEEYVRKYFWTLGIVVVLTSSVFAAKAVNHIIESKLLADSDSVKRPKVKKRSRVKRSAGKMLSKNGEPLSKRNIFCSECKPAEPDPTDPDVVGDGSLEPLTSLPLRLVATNVSSINEESFATIRNTDTKGQGSYWLASAIPNAGPVKKISSNYVVFHNKESRRNERIALFAKDQPKKTTRKTRKRRRPRGRRGALLAMMDEGIKKISNTQYEIDRALVDKLLKSPGMAARGARIVPSVRNGKPNGIKLYAIRPSSIYAKLGLRNGDTISSINGFPISTSPDKALELYTKLKSSSNIALNVTHRGKNRTVNYSIK